MLVAGCWLSLLLPSFAPASVVRVQPHPEPVYGREIVYRAAPSEHNAVTVREVVLISQWFGEPWEVHDPGAVIRAEAPCRVIDIHTARCGNAFATSGGPIGDPIGGYRVLLGDGDDTVAVTPTTASGDASWLAADGGPGDDVLSGGKSGFVLGDQLTGGGGRDELHGGPGDDTLADGDQSDGDGELAPDADVLDGGPGTDTVSYAGRSAPVAVDLDRPDEAGEQDEGDRLAGIESVTGGAAPDWLAGDHRTNVLEGGSGSDRLNGRSGDDQLLGGSENRCGGGQDAVVQARRRYAASNPLGFVKPDCERIDPWHAALLRPYPAVVTATEAVFRVRCPVDRDGDGPQACSADITLRHAGDRQLLGRGSFRRGRWELRPLVVSLTPLGRLLAARSGGVRADVRFSGVGFPAPAGWTIRLEVES